MIALGNAEEGSWGRGFRRGVSTKAELGRGELEGAEGEQREQAGAGGDTHSLGGLRAPGPAKGYPRVSGEWATPTESFASSHAEL